MDALSGDIEGTVYRFEDFRLVPGRQSLPHRDRPVRVGSRALELLHHLVERPGELMGKAALMRRAWPDTHVHEDNLKVNIAALRRALHMTGGQGPYIATVPGRGYRFVAPVRVESCLQDAPSLAAASGPTLPDPIGVIGRDGEIARIMELLSEKRFVTVVGMAGVGKTTVAVASARQAMMEYPDGVCFVDLAAIGDPQFVTAAIATAIGSGGNLNDLMAGIVEALRGRRRLLILDNCEHVLQAAAVAAAHIRANVPELAILATSREPLRCRSETVLRLAPLTCPWAAEGMSSEQALAFSSVVLFVERAAEAANYRMSDADASAIAAICRRLDGLPLAIELAAPRLKTCNVPTLLSLLERSFEPLSCGPSEAPIRQQALISTLDWSYRLLSPDEASALRLVSVFAGDFTIADAIGVGGALGRTPEELVQGIESLAAKSLLSAGYSEEGLHYRLLETTRMYATDRLRSAAEHVGVAAAHARFLLDKFEGAEAEWQWRVREDWTSVYRRYVNDLRRALDWAFGQDGEPLLGVRLTAAAIPLWDELSSVGESRVRVQRALQSEALADCDPLVRMKLMTAYAWGMTFAERLEPEAETSWKESLSLAEQMEEVDYQLRALWGLASLRSFIGQHRLALGDITRFEKVAERANDQAAVAAGERLRLITGFYCGNVRGAREELEHLAGRYDNPARRTRISRFQMDHYVGTRVSLALVSWVCGRPDEAMALAEAALDGAIEIEHAVSQANALAQAVIPIALWTGRVEAAERHLATLVASLNQRNLAIWGPLCRFFAGVLREEQGLEGMRDALDELAACNVMIRMPMFRSMLAEAALAHGRMDLASENVVAALELAGQEEPWCYPEALRVHGLLQWRRGDARAARVTLRRSASIAAEMGALEFERRARQSVSRIQE